MANWPVQTKGVQDKSGNFVYAEVNSVAISNVPISAGGKMVVAGTTISRGYDPSALPPVGTYAYDANGNEVWHDMRPPIAIDATGTPKDSGIYWVAISRDGKWTASGGGKHSEDPTIDPADRGVGYVNAYDMAANAYDVAGNKIPIPCVDPATNNPVPMVGGVNMVALSSNGSYLVAGANAAYVFQRQNGRFELIFEQSPTDARDLVTAVAISDDGSSVVFGVTGAPGTNNDYVYLIQKPFLADSGASWPVPDGQYIKSVAMAADGSAFAVLATNKNHSETNVYYFNLDSNKPDYFPTMHPPNNVWSYPLTDNNGNPCDGGLSVAISADGSRVSAVANNSDATLGCVFFLCGQTGARLWQTLVQHGPNSTSMDAKGQYITVADGYLSPGDFYLFNEHGDFLVLPGLQPNQPGGVPAWTMQISEDGAAIAAGDDNGWVYYFAAPAFGWQSYPWRFPIIEERTLWPGPIDPGPLRQYQVVVDMLEKLSVQVTEMNDRLSKIESALSEKKLTMTAST